MAQPLPSQNPNLPLPRGIKPCIIPQLSKQFGSPLKSPFARAYPPDLVELTGITPDEILSFIDDLNRAFMENPALQATGDIAGAVGFIPLATAQIVSVSIEVAANASAVGVSLVRTRQCLKQANLTLFGPRGLRAQVLKTGKMLDCTGVGFVDVYSRVEEEIGEGSGPLQERMRVFGDSVMPLVFKGTEASLPAKGQESWMRKLSAAQVRKAEKKQLEELGKKQEKRKKKIMEREESVRGRERKYDKSIDSILQRIQGKKTELEKERQADDGSKRHSKECLRKEEKIESLEKELQKAEAHKKAQMLRKGEELQKERQKRAKREEEKREKMYWLVITPIEEVPAGEDDLDGEC